jgi:site-specific DNA recombinase
MSETKRVGIWVRVSTDRQVEGDSPEHHEQRARYYAEHKEWTVVELYRLDAMSGKSVWDYPDTKRMLKDVKSGHINGLIFSKLARLARNTRELLEFADIFKASQADLISLAENIDTSTHIGKFFYTLLAALAEWERNEIVDRVKASVPVRARMGKPLGGASSYGYRWENKALVIDDNEAPVRKLLYELFVKHQRKKATAKALNNLGYRTRNGSPFSDTTVTRLLRDSTAKGERVANYTQTTEKNKNWTLKPKDEWITVPCPAIVSADLWNECNAILDAQEKKRAPGRTAAHLLSGLVKCHCGKTMYVYHKNNIYRCTACNNRIALSDIDEIYEAHLKEYLQGINLDEYVHQHDEQIQEKKALLEKTQKECAKLTRQINEWVTMRSDGELSKEAFAAVYWPAENRVRQLEQTVPELEAEIDVRTVQMMNSDKILTDAKAVYDRWKEVSFEEKRAIVEIVTNNVEIGSDEIIINLAHTPQFLNDGKRQHGDRGSCLQPT